MDESPRAHPYGRSADDVRRRIQRTRRTRRVRIAQLLVFSVLAIALISVAVHALGKLREPVRSEERRVGKEWRSRRGPRRANQHKRLDGARRTDIAALRPRR